MTKKFEPCPHCGKDVELFTVRSNTKKTKRFFKCPSCGLRTSDMYGNIDEVTTMWTNFVSAGTCTYQKSRLAKNDWECSLCHWVWTYSESSSPITCGRYFCPVCGSRIQDCLDENGKSVRCG